MRRNRSRTHAVPTSLARIPVVTVVVAAILAACSAPPEAPPAEVLEDNSSDTPWVAARRAADVALLSVPARVVPDARSQAVVALPADARVVAVEANVGDELEAGAPIADVVLPELAEAAGRFIAARLRQKAYQRVLEQLKELDKHGLARLQDRADAEVKLAEAAAEEQVGRAALTAAGLTVKDAERLAASGGRMTLRSPLAGRLAESRAVVGAQLTPADGPFARVAAVASTRVEARVPLGIGAFERGSFAPTSGEPRAAAREGCLPEVEAQDSAVRCWFSLEGSALPSHLPGLLRLEAPADNHLLAVPRDAVGIDASGSYVVRRSRDGERERVAVRVVAAAGGDAVVEGELREGQLVAARAQAVEGAAG